MPRYEKVADPLDPLPRWKQPTCSLRRKTELLRTRAHRAHGLHTVSDTARNASQFKLRLAHVYAESSLGSELSRPVRPDMGSVQSYCKETVDSSRMLAPRQVGVEWRNNTSVRSFLASR
jgi:hypothetical protein